MYPPAACQTPTPALMAFFKLHGRSSVSRIGELQSKALSLIVAGRTLMASDLHAKLDRSTQLANADRVSAMCSQALYLASGFGAVNVNTVFESQAALEVLVAELELSPLMADPLRHLRSRTEALASGGASDPMDTFVAFQAKAMAEALLGWTEAYMARAGGYGLSAASVPTYSS